MNIGLMNSTNNKNKMLVSSIHIFSFFIYSSCCCSCFKCTHIKPLQFLLHTSFCYVRFFVFLLFFILTNAISSEHKHDKHTLTHKLQMHMQGGSYTHTACVLGHNIAKKYVKITFCFQIHIENCNFFL